MKTEKLRGDSKKPRAAVWKNKRKRRCSFQPDADDKRSGATGFLRAETAPVVMRLSDTRQSRDECLHGRTQLWARAARKLMSQEDITQTAPSMVAPEKADECDEEELCSRQDKDPTSVGTQRPEPDGSPSTRMIPTAVQRRDRGGEPAVQ